MAVGLKTAFLSQAKSTTHTLAVRETWVVVWCGIDIIIKNKNKKFYVIKKVGTILQLGTLYKVVTNSFING